ncbi:unnamed protein product [Ectocarpus sp. CCAP 1310/34]|nr:unnamed protein product [Ectocarpus sp. CCAP 1310/34]
MTSTSESSLPSPSPELSSSSISNTSNKSAIVSPSSDGPASSTPAAAASPSARSGFPWASELSSLLAHASSSDPSKARVMPAFLQLERMLPGSTSSHAFFTHCASNPLDGGSG